jgi:thiamine pyrophosphate-dependent acetolactate synthase large subunit-like protein
MDPSSLLRLVRRAIKIASTPPMGPVYVCLPQDVLDAPAEEAVRPTWCLPRAWYLRGTSLPRRPRRLHRPERR